MTEVTQKVVEAQCVSCSWAWGHKPVTLGPTLEIILVWGAQHSRRRQ